MKRMLLILAIVLVSSSAASVLIPVYASAAVAENCNKSNNFLGFPTWYKYLDIGESTQVFKDGTTGVVDDCAIIGPVGTDGKLDPKAVASRIALAIVDILLRVGGLIAVVFVIIGGFKYITSQGEPENTKNARSTIMNAVIGLVISITATAAIAFIGNKFIL